MTERHQPEGASPTTNVRTPKGHDPTVSPEEDLRAASHALAELTRPARTMRWLATLLQVIGSAATIVPFIAIAALASDFLAPGTPPGREHVTVIIEIAVTGLSVRVMFEGVAVILTHLADLRIQRETRLRIVERLGQVPLGWFSRHSSGLVRKATQDDVDEIHYLVAHGALDTASAITVPLTGVVFLALLDWRLALVGVCTLPLYGVLSMLMVRDAETKNAQMEAGSERIGRTLVEFVNGIAVVKTFGRAGAAHAAYLRAADRFADAYNGWVQPMLRADSLASIPISAPVVLTINLAFGIWFLAEGWVDVVSVITAAVVAMTLPGAILKISFSMQSRYTAAAAALRLYTLVTTPVLPEPESSQRQHPSGTAVEFEHVEFAYEQGHPVLKDVSLTLPEGTVTALVGPSGSGKSTLASLVARFQDPDAGHILLGGADLRDIPSEELYQRVGFVLQDVQLITDTVAENIRLARPEATHEEVRAAARTAQIDTEILSLPKGYDSVIGRDVNLSGGQAQRVSIARVLLADPSVLVLDEATAFADPESEAHIQRALSHAIVGRTLLVIAHRLETITTADTIVVLDQGRIDAEGTHDQLIREGGLYAHLWDLSEATKEARP